MRRLIALANSLGGDDEDIIMAAVAQLTEAAAFLDGLASHLLHDEPVDLADCAADCRAMAAKLRGKTREPPPPPDDRGTSMV